jgi:mono/diheme cytochrome c family protein
MFMNHLRVVSMAGLISTMSLLAIAGCSNNTESTTQSTPGASQTSSQASRPDNPPSAKSPSASKQSNAPQSNATLIAAGKIVFTSAGCMKCHAVSGQGGQGGGPPGGFRGGPGGPPGRPGGGGPSRPGGGPGRGRGKGPELTHVGAEAEHTPEWIVAHIKNPKTHNPRSRMPAFEGKISDKDLLALGAYLSSLK